MFAVFLGATLYCKGQQGRSRIARRSSVQPPSRRTTAKPDALAWWRFHVPELVMSPSLATRKRVPCKFARRL